MPTTQTSADLTGLTWCMTSALSAVAAGATAPSAATAAMGWPAACPPGPLCQALAAVVVVVLLLDGASVANGDRPADDGLADGRRDRMDD